GAGYRPEAAGVAGAPAPMVEHELLKAERNAALREAFTQLPPGSQQLIAMLIEDPPVADAEIAARLGIPAGSIGPSRGRCLEQLRGHPAVAALISARPPAAGPPPAGPTLPQSAPPPPPAPVRRPRRCAPDP